MIKNEFLKIFLFMQFVSIILFAIIWGASRFSHHPIGIYPILPLFLIIIGLITILVEFIFIPLSDWWFND